ncbi:CHAT domain-containing protein [Kamptonema sp. UHCC 0994]|nr:CHAT domain-containing protein [Kamptonema sp. UHCC 0994]MDF0552582.1 CHAT domain-containing protein [Kamptonema sp. UHCC 0994]
MTSGSAVNKAEALRQAQLSLLIKKPDPYYWAPFVMIGNWL